MSSAVPRLSLAILCPALLAGLMASSCARPTLSLQAPGRIALALERVTDLEATATLVAQGGEALEPVALTRGDDGVSFSGFLPAEPGVYVLELVFTGVVDDGDRGFLGRLTSDSFTVTEGSSAEPVFSTALDTLGRDGDGGDLDADGLGLLDEILLGTNPDSDDSDGDDVLDGADCDPSDSAQAFAIADGGSVLDCDADTFVRVDAPFGPAGDDCDDEDAAINPAAVDDCGTVVDEDCRPSTCPVDDADGPVVSQVAPAAGVGTGCHARLSARVDDPSDVASVVAVFVDEPLPSGERVVALSRGSGADANLWTSPSLHLTGAAQPFPQGDTTVEFRAVDSVGNTSRTDHTLTFELGAPTLTLNGPSTVANTGTISIGYSATAVAAVTTVRLWGVPPAAVGFDLADAVLVDEQTSASGNFSFDSGGLGDVQLLVPEVIDAVGNRLGPGGQVFPSQGTVTSDYFCAGTQSVPTVPVRQRGGSGAPATLRGLLPEAQAAAEAVDPTAALVNIVGFNVRGDGSIDLDSTTNFVTRWEYQFYSATNDRFIAVRWLTAAFAIQNPQVDPNAGNASLEDPLTDVDNLADSPALAAAFAASAGCGALTGADGHNIIVNRASGDDRALVTTGDQTLSLDAQTLGVIFGCD